MSRELDNVLSFLYDEGNIPIAILNGNFLIDSVSK